MNKLEQATLAKLQECFELMAQGTSAQAVEIPENCDPSFRQMLDAFNNYLVQQNDARAFINELAAGNLEVTPPVRNQIAAPYKQFHASLQHLTWQTRQIAQGDYKQRVHFLGEFSNSFNSMVEALEEKARTEKALQDARDQVQHLEGIIPICMYCKQIRDDEESWHRLEDYISKHSDAKFSHGICPTCYENKMKEYDLRAQRKSDK